MKYLLLLLLPSFAFANCLPIDLTDPTYLQKKGKAQLAEHYSKPRDQDGVGWCVAFAMSDLYSHATGIPISATDMTVSYFMNDHMLTNANSVVGINSGMTSELMMDWVKERGLCPENIIPSNITGTSNMGQKTMLDLMKAFESLTKKYQEASTKPCVQCSAEFKNVIAPALPGLSGEAIATIVAKNQGDFLRTLGDTMNEMCRGSRKKVKSSYVRLPNGFGGRDVASETTKALTNDSLVEVSMIVGDIGSFTGHTAQQGHSMVITGQQPGPDGQCRYTIRNSWGKGCYFYNEKFRKRCDDKKGNFWVTTEELISLAGAVTYLLNTSLQK